MSAAPNLAREKRFDWPLCHQAEEIILGHLAVIAERNTFARQLAARLPAETGTLLIDWVDHLVLPATEEAPLRATGYVADPLAETPAGERTLWHPDAMLPRVLLAPTALSLTLALRVESVSDFLAAHSKSAEPAGGPLSRYRNVLIAEENNARVLAVERRGYAGHVVAPMTPELVAAQLKAAELWRHRRRIFDQDADGWRASLALLDRIVAMTGRDLACHLVFTEERAYWQQRNRAARVQKARQDALGLGWANHDHHTFRCAREHFVDLMCVLEKLGFERRERYYAGAQAGWGAQILEHPIEAIVTFCDVDLEPDETEIDFSRQPLAPGRRLGTIGLWTGLHGESFLDAGMHHLECRFDYALLREQLAAAGVNTMKPFSDFDFLKQAFTEGERWPVRRERAERLLRAGLITQSQFDQFMQDGAIGSHLENLQRKGGFKGFNQKAVSVIIQATDPRLHSAGH